MFQHIQLIISLTIYKSPFTEKERRKKKNTIPYSKYLWYSVQIKTWKLTSKFTFICVQINFQRLFVFCRSAYPNLLRIVTGFVRPK